MRRRPSGDFTTAFDDCAISAAALKTRSEQDLTNETHIPETISLACLKTRLSKINMMSGSDSSRRNFLQTMTAALAVSAVNAQPSAATVINMPFPEADPKLGLIGTGGRGTSLLKNFLAADVQVHALCDIVPEKAQNAQS